MTSLFLTTMSAVLLANVLTVAFVWAFWQYSKQERKGREKEVGSSVYLGTITAVFCVILVGLWQSGFMAFLE